MPQASFGYFGVAVETTPGTGVAPTKYLPVKDVDFPVENNFIDIREIRGSRQAYQTFDGALRSSFNLTSSFYPLGAMGVFLRALFGDQTAAASTGSSIAFDHTFIDAATLPSLSVERADAKNGAGGVIVQRLVGCKVESVGFSCSFGEDVEVKVAGQGLKFPDSSVTRAASPTFPTIAPVVFTGASVLVDGVANNYFKSINFEFTNTLERQEALRGTRESYAMFEGGLECTLSGTMVFADLTIYDKLKNSDYLTVEADFVSSDVADPDATPDPIIYGASFQWPKVKVSTFGIPFTAGEVIEADVEFQVSFDLTTNKLVNVVMTNLDAGTAYNT